MKDSHIKSLISDYIDGILDDSTRARVEQHLQSCRECQRVYQDFKRIKSELNSLNSISASPFFASKVMTAYKSVRTGSFWAGFNFLPRPVIHGAIIVSLLILFFIGWPQFHHTSGTTQESVNSLDYVLTETEPWAEVPLNTDDQALQFALNTKIVNEGE